MFLFPPVNLAASESSERPRRVIFVGICMAVVVATLGRPTLAQSENEPRELFDGKTLTGWEGDLNHWRVENGAIVGEIPEGQTLNKNTWLVWRDGKLKDFDLRLQVKLTGDPTANSGIQFRCQVESVDHVSGYQADLDMGATWLGRIYDEHGRALIVERGTRVTIGPDGKRSPQTLAPAEQFAVLFRENEWNDYRIVGIGEHIAVFINGTIFAELRDQQVGERDLEGSLAVQLHSGPHTRVEFRNIRLETLKADDTRLDKLSKRRPARRTEGRSTRNPLLSHLVPNPVEQSDKSNASNTVAQMYVPDGFSVDVIAAEPQLHQPMAFTFDAKGRLWVVEGHCYPQKRPEGEGLDRVLIFSDEDANGSYETRKVFIEGLNLVSGMEVGYGGVWIGAAPELLFIPDKDGDDRPDSPPQVLLDGFGYADTHETLNSFLWGPDGWLYGNQGVFNKSNVGKPGSNDGERHQFGAAVWRYHPTRHTFEVFAHGGSNQWGLDYDEFGQMFMTHCRSRWGKGPTTHVMQGGHYWNQVNGGYAPYVSNTATPELPLMRNYMLASARYGHGEGGAGKPGTREVYGGHSHVGTMFYLGDNWPDEYRNHLFTHNLHGHQMNQQVNRREAGGFNTLHAGQDVLFCSDRQYIGVDLKYGPDGAVYINDWYDPRLCHNPIIEQWDRGNGRLYRMQFDATYEPKTVDWNAASDMQLAAAQLHKNDWHVRTARRVLSERSAERRIAGIAKTRLLSIAFTHIDPERRLRALWALHGIGEIIPAVVVKMLDDDNEFVRAWAVQLAVEDIDPQLLPGLLLPLAERESSLLVRRYLASAIQRLPAELGWQLVEVLSSQADNADDRDLPLLLWYGIGELMPNNFDHALALAETTQIPALRDYIPWYAARVSDVGRVHLVEQLASAQPDGQNRLLSLLGLGVLGTRGLVAPDGWTDVSPRLYDSSDVRTKRIAESLGAAFGDTQLFDRMRDSLADSTSNLQAQQHAVSILAYDTAEQNLPLFLKLLDETALVPQLLPLLTRYADPRVATELIARIPEWSQGDSAAAMEVLASRVPWALQTLDSIAAGDLEKKHLAAYNVRQMTQLGDTGLNERLENEWGALQQSSQERRAEIAAMAETFSSAPLWAYNVKSGAAHFKKLCANCHQPDGLNESLGPKLAGTRTKGIEYIVENVIDPNAVIGRDFQARVVVTRDGRVVNGLIEMETPSAVTIRTATNSVTVARSEIEEILISDNSFMPENLLKDLTDAQKIELFKYLMSL